MAVESREEYLIIRSVVQWIIWESRVNNDMVECEQVLTYNSWNRWPIPSPRAAFFLQKHFTPLNLHLLSSSSISYLPSVAVLTCSFSDSHC